MSRTIFVAGMGRSGTTLLADILNFHGRWRLLFEPFFPGRVSEASRFKYIHYLRRGYDDTMLIADARRILAGDIRNSWVDRVPVPAAANTLIIKDIRCNLMLAWLKNIAPQLPIVLIVRHPLQVAASWLRLNWGASPYTQSDDFSIITGQKALVNDFPIIQEIESALSPLTPLDKVIFVWCVLHLVPLKTLKPNEYHIVFYESLVSNSGDEIERIFKYIGESFDTEQILGVLGRSSSTNFRGRQIAHDKSALLSSWQREFSIQQISRAHEILAAFGFDQVYTKDGHPNAFGTINSNSLFQ